MSGTSPPPLLVLGATGVVGRGVVQAALVRDRPVIAVARDAGALAALQAEAPDRITALAGSVADDAAGAALAARLRALDRPLGGVVACVCGRAAAGAVLDQPADALRRRLDEDLLPHLAAARHLLPVLATRGHNRTWVMVGGPGDARPWAGHGHRSVGAAALRMMARVLHDEARGQGVRVHLLSVGGAVCDRPALATARPDRPSAIAIGQQVLALVDRGHHPQSLPPVIPFDTAAPGGSTASGHEADPSTLPPVESPPARPSLSLKCGAAAPTDRADLLPEGCQQAARRLLWGLLAPLHPASPQDKDLPS